MDTVLEGTNKPLSYYWNDVIIKIKHIIKRILYNLRRIKSYKVPREVAESIEGVYQECLKYQNLRLIVADNQELQEMIDSVYRSSAYITLFKNCNIRKFNKEDFISVDTGEIIKKLKTIDSMIEVEERYLNNKRYGSTTTSESIVDYQKRFELISQFYTIELNAINKYFTYGKPMDESIPLGREIEVEPDID